MKAKRLNMGYIACITLILVSIGLRVVVFVLKKTTRTTSSYNEIAIKRNTVANYIKKTYKLESDTILTDFEGHNFTFNKNKCYLISVLDLMIATGSIDKFKNGVFDFYIDGNAVSMFVDKDLYPSNLFEKDCYLLFQINEINRIEDKYIEKYNLKTKGICFINEDYFYEKALNTY